MNFDGVTIDLTCHTPPCWQTARYLLSDITVRLHPQGVCTVEFYCQTCQQRSEFVVPDEVGMKLDQLGAPTVVVSEPGQLHERLGIKDAPIREDEVGLIERSTLDHFNRAAQRELLR